MLIAIPSAFITTDTSIVNGEFEQRKYYVNQTRFKEQLLDDTNPNSLTSKTTEVGRYPILSSNNQSMLSQISNKIKENISGQISNLAFERDLVNLYNVFAQYKNEKGYQMIGEVFAISLKSCEWWRNNPEAFAFNNLKIKEAGPSQFIEDNPYVLPIVGLDAGGALVGSCSVALNNYINTGTISWSAVGTGAVIGAVTGSTGLAGRVGRWLNSLF